MDAKSVIEGSVELPNITVGHIVIKNGTTLMRMVSGSGSWTTASGVVFSKRQPFQVVPVSEVESLLISGRFKVATAEEAKEFFNQK